MNPKTKTIIAITLPIAVLIIIVAVYYLKQPSTVLSQKSSYQLSSKELNKEYLLNDSLADQKYSSKIIEIKGPVGNIQNSKMHGTIITMDDAMMGVRCVMDTLRPLPAGLGIGDLVKIKGVMIGFDPLIGVMMNKCVLTEATISSPNP